MIRRIFSSMFSSPLGTRRQAAGAAGSLLFGMVSVLIASAFLPKNASSGILPNHADRILKVGKWIDKPGGEHLPSTKTSGLLAPVLAAEIPEVELAARVMAWPEPVLLTNFNQSVSVKRWSFADPGILQLFDVAFVYGDARTALNAPGQVVLTEAMAGKLFGSANPVGKPVLGLGGKTYTVGGVVRNPAPQSMLPFEVLASWSSTVSPSGLHDFRFMNNWAGQTAETYLLLQRPEQALRVEERLPQVIEQHVPGTAGSFNYFVQPLLEAGSSTGALEQKTGILPHLRVGVSG